MPRVTIARLMLGVAGLALVFAAGRVHFSLGALVFGLGSIATVRTYRWRDAEHQAGRVVTPGRLAGKAVASLGVAAASLLVVLIGAILTDLAVTSSFGLMPTTEAVVLNVIIGSVGGLGFLRFARWFGRNALAELPPIREPDGIPASGSPPDAVPSTGEAR